MVKENITLSIVIPAYNCADTVGELLDCIARQNLPSFEVIVVNDGSTDRTLELLTEKGKEYSWLQVYTKENGGAPKARNLGIDKAQGEYLYLCDADDLLYDGGLEKLLAFAQEKNLDVAVSDLCTIDGQGKAHRYDAFGEKQEKLGGNGFLFCDPIPGTKLYRREFIEENGIRFDSVKVGQDLNFYLKAACTTVRIARLKEMTYIYRTSFSGISKTYKIQNLLDIKNSLGGVIAYCKQKGVYVGERKIALEYVKRSHYLWQLKKKKHVKKEDYARLRKELLSDLDLRTNKSRRYAFLSWSTWVEFFFAKNFNIILRGI